jgi:serine/threonine protein phosphatase PrpC
VKYAYGSDTGLCREMNEDCVGIFKIANTFTVALLLDGMGGANGGQIASLTAYEAMMTELELRLSFLLCSGEPIQQKTIGNELKQACEAVNSIVWHRQSMHPIFMEWAPQWLLLFVMVIVVVY